MTMTISVRLEFVPIVAYNDQWQTDRFTREVWKWDGTGVTVKSACPPDGYAVGLLTAYINGDRVLDLGRLDAVLARVGPFTRADIKRAIASAPPTT